jgi:Ca2+-binding EF-hand superfamily protein
MRSLIVLSAIVAVVAPLAAGQGSPPATAPAAATAPATPRVADLPDVLRSAVDPYDGPAERARFFQAAGVDNELDAKEFAAARGRAGSFVRLFDAWPAMLAFDKDHNGTIDWFEADAYRQDLRRRVLNAFDTNKDGQLTGKERQAANEMLASGRVPAGPAVANPLTAGQAPAGKAATTAPGGEDQADQNWLRERAIRQRAILLELYDTNHDGKLDEAERKAMLEGVRKDAEEQVAEQRLRRWDTNGDGKLDANEAAAMEAATAAGKQRTERRQHREDLARWDANGDGKLDEAETAAMQAERTRQNKEGEAWQRQWELKQYDINGDGILDENERLVADADRARRDVYGQQEAEDQNDQAGKRQWDQTIARWRLKNFDTNGDGKLDANELAAVKKFEGQFKALGENLRLRFADLDGDGKVSKEEEAAVQAEWRKVGWKVLVRAFRYLDTDGDGQVSPAERAEFTTRVQAGLVQHIERLSARYADKDGRLNEAARTALIEGIRKDLDARINKFDANHDGRLDPSEAIEMMEDFLQNDLGIHPNAPPAGAGETAPKQP